MPRRWLACLATAGLFAFASVGQCKPPDLPHYQQITVLPHSPQVDPNLIATFGFLCNFPIQILGVSDPISLLTTGDEETSEPRAPESPRRSPVQEPSCRGCPIQTGFFAADRRHDPAASRSVLDNLKLLEDAAELVEKARALAREGKVDEAKECLEKVRKMAPGSPCEKSIDELMKEIATEEEQESKKDEPQTKKSRSWRKIGVRWLERLGQLVPQARVKVEIEIGPSQASQNLAHMPVPPCFPGCFAQHGMPMPAHLPMHVHEVYYLRNTSAVDVAKALSQFTQNLQNLLPVLSRGGAIPYSEDFAREVMIVPEPSTNRLLIIATPRFVPDVMRLIAELDANGPPYCAFVEGMRHPHRCSAAVVGNVVRVTGADNGRLCPPMRQTEDPAACEESVCPKCEMLHNRAVRNAKSISDGKAELVNGLMKACRLAVADGRLEKAADLARQAHAIDPETVESDPMVVKMDLLEQFKPAPRPDRSPTPAGAAEEQEERGADGTSKLVPHFPALEAKIVEALDAMLRRKR